MDSCGLTPEHAAYLAAHAITEEVVRAAGIRSAVTVDDLPEWARSWGDKALPAIVFPWRSPSGVVVEQVRPDRPLVWDGKEHKYLWPRGAGAILNEGRADPAADTVLIVEGTKQTYAAASWAPEGIAVYGIGGCRNWSTDGIPISDLEVVDGHRVVVALDADVSTNLDVYTAGLKLGEAVRVEGATSVGYVRLGTGGTVGLDDWLAKKAPDRRTDRLHRLVAQATPKPADSKPKPRTRRADEDASGPAVPTDRPVILVDGDRWTVINEVTDVLLNRWNGTRLFNHGEVLSELTGTELSVLTRGSFYNLLSETAFTARRGNEGSLVPTWPDPQTIEAVMNRASRFAPLERVVTAPFVRLDGSICQANGYDEATGVMVVMDPALAEVQIPDHPSADQVARARKLILDEWWGDLPLETEADKANALALFLTPFVRLLMPVVPAAVVDGLQMGVGKNLFVDCIHIVLTGGEAKPLGWSRDDEETRKIITSAFRSGAEMIVFDEAHHVESVSLARALTAAKYQDRQLGSSQLLGFPNRVTWVVIGNNVRVEGDMARRVYRIALRPTAPDPHNRPASSFRHSDLRLWTREHRAELMAAGLTLVRAWFAAGRPAASRRESFGSFEVWERVLGGIVEHAGQPGLLDNLAGWRSETSFDAAIWCAHIQWLHETFGDDTPFTCAEARSKMAGDPGSEPPPGMTDLAGDTRDYNRRLGQAYARIADRYFNGLRLIKCDTGRQGKVGAWRVVSPTPTVKTQVVQVVEVVGEDREDTYPVTTRVEHTHTAHVAVHDATHTRVIEQDGSHLSPVSSAPSVRHDVAAYCGTSAVKLPPGHLAFDIETASEEEFWTRGRDFIRLCGYQVGDRVRLTTDPMLMLGHIQQADVVIGHNIMAYDLLAFAGRHGLDLRRLADEGRLFDTKLTAILTDPPPARPRPGQVQREYSLDRLGQQHFGDGKTGDLKALVKEFGGYDRIPVDDERYGVYCAGDVDLTARLSSVMRLTDYAKREHRVAAVAAQIRTNGFRVDLPLLAQRVAAAKHRRGELVADLIDRYGLPTANKQGKPSKSPQSTAEGKAKLIAAFEALGVDLPKTPNGNPSLGGKGLEVLAEQYADRPDVLALIEPVRALNGVRSVYETVDKHLVGDRVHPEIDMFQASGRWSTKDPGLTVMGKRGGRHVEREIFLPEPGHVIVSADLAQIDARAIAAWSQDPNYLALFEPGIDSHREVARMVWGDEKRRDDAKAIGHGWNYGMSIAGLARNAKVTEQVATEFDRAMREQFPGLVEWRDGVREQASGGDLLDNGFGRLMRADPQRAWTQGPALMGQGCARDLMMEGLLRLPAEVLPLLRAVVHDEIVLSVPVDIADDVERAVLAALSFEWAPPGASRTVRIEAGLGERRGRNWGHVYAKDAP